MAQAYALQAEADGGEKGSAPEGPALGSLITVTADEERDYGLVCDISSDDDLVGLLTPSHLPTGLSPVTGTSLVAVVLDKQLLEGIVDLSMKEVS